MYNGLLRFFLTAFLSFVGVLLGGVTSSSLSTSADKTAYVDTQGVLRWNGSDEEVALLGVNYYTPFTIDYAAIRRMGGDHRQAILDDVSHFRRLGCGCVRVHCFDREFSDEKGNFNDNHHVEMLDFLISTCASNGLYTVLTPIAWWGGSYAPGNIHGFSNDFKMQEMTTDPEAWKIQARFLKQFAEHVNRFTGKRYADDPAVLSFECINEPLYPKDTPDSLVTSYVNTLADALRASGTRKPIYYNSWHGRNAAVGAARVDGVTAVNYPTGLLAGHALSGSQLLRARGSSLDPDESIATKSRMVYEFDAADVPGSHMYPSIAKFFRSESIQVASQFQYDPMVLADVNRNWQTHHLNLIYTPGKALSLAIAAEVFKRIPRGVTFGKLPEAATFPPFRSSGDEDLSEMAASDAFIYSNTTTTEAPEPKNLKRVWGCGTSPCVSYQGSGAYFIDFIESGVWRLQVYPDIFQVEDAYIGTSQRKIYLLPSERRMKIKLPDLGKTYSIYTFKSAECQNGFLCDGDGGFLVKPGDYLLVRSGVNTDQTLLRKAAGAVPPYAAPAVTDVQGPLMRAGVQSQWKSGEKLLLQVKAVLATNVVANLVSPAGKIRRLQMHRKKEDPVTYFTELGPGELSSGTWGVGFTAIGNGIRSVWPDKNMRGIDWFYDGETSLSLLRLPVEDKLMQDLKVTRHGVDSTEISCVVGKDKNRRAVALKISGVAEGSSAAGFLQSFASSTIPRNESGMGLRVVARSTDNVSAMEIGFRMRNGQGLGCNIHLSPAWNEYLVPISDMQGLWGLSSIDAFRWENVQTLSVLTGAWLLKDLRKKPQTIEVQSIDWVQMQPRWPLVSVGGGIPWSIFDADEWLRLPLWRKPIKRWRVYDYEGRPGIHLGVDGFNQDLDSVSVRGTCDGRTLAELWKGKDEDAVLHVCVRASTPDTTAFELALVESSGVAWGTEVKLTQHWQTVHIPIKKLRLFSHWDPETAKGAGDFLRLSKLQKVNVCFGRWLFPQKADLPHAIEISAIGITSTEKN